MNIQEFNELLKRQESGETLSKAEYSKMQEYLEGRGYPVGSSGVDGNWGPDSKSALGAYKSSGAMRDDIDTLKASSDPLAIVNGEYVNPNNVFKAIGDGEITWDDVDVKALNSEWLRSNGIDPVEVKSGNIDWENLEAKRADTVERYNTQVAAEGKLKADRDFARADVYNVTKAAVDLQKAAQSSNQIRHGQERLDELQSQKPQAPYLPRGAELQEATQQAGARAQRGLSSRTLGALGSRDLSAYATALANAQRLGQGSNVGALTSQLYRDTIGRNLDRAVQDEGANAANFNQYAQLAGARANELKDINAYKYRTHMMDRGEYNKQLGEAAAEKRAGLINQSNLLATLPTTAGNLAYGYYKSGEQRGSVPLTGTPERAAYDASRARTPSIDAATEESNGRLKLAKKQKMKNYFKNMFNNTQEVQEDTGFDPTSSYYGGFE